MNRKTAIHCQPVAQARPVMSGLLRRKCDCGNHTITSGECGECGKKRLQRTNGNAASTVDVPPLVHEVLHSSGQPLDDSTRAFLESRFGYDFTQVRIHADARAADSAASVNALAYSVGRNVVFGAGNYAPQTSAGRRLLAHELTHTLQPQTGASSRLKIDDREDVEQEANVMADAVERFDLMPKAVTVEPHQLTHNLAPAMNLCRKPKDDARKETPPKDTPPKKEKEKCEKFPGGATECEINEVTGIPTGKVTKKIDETNPCTRPCVEQHESVHVEQMKKLCKELRSCYLDADKGKRDATDCWKLAMFTAALECEAYKVSVACMEKQIKSNKLCQSEENKAYAKRKLESEKCFRDANCGANESGGSSTSKRADKGTSTDKKKSSDKK